MVDEVILLFARFGMSVLKTGRRYCLSSDVEVPVPADIVVTVTSLRVVVVSRNGHPVMRLKLDDALFSDLLRLLASESIQSLQFDLGSNVSVHMQHSLIQLQVWQVLCMPVRDLGLGPDFESWCNFHHLEFVHQLLKPYAWWVRHGESRRLFVDRFTRILHDLNARYGIDLALGYDLTPFQPLPPY
jgi:hypothetical protein